jgi:hypothetical protein
VRSAMLTITALLLFTSSASAIPPCNVANHFCIWGQLLDSVPPPTFPQVSPFCTNGNPCKGPVDLCYQFDTGCTSPIVRICQLSTASGEDGSYQFIVPINNTWRVKPAVGFGHLQWTPVSSTAFSSTQFQTAIRNFTRTAAGPGSACNW